MQSIKRFLLLLIIISLTPFIMAPGDDGCPACDPEWKWEEKVKPGSSNIHKVYLESGFYGCKLAIINGSASLELFGSYMTDLTCKGNNSYGTECTFHVLYDSPVSLEVNGGLKGGNYSLNLYEN